MWLASTYLWMWHRALCLDVSFEDKHFLIKKLLTFSYGISQPAMLQAQPSWDVLMSARSTDTHHPPRPGFPAVLPSFPSATIHHRGPVGCSRRGLTTGWSLCEALHLLSTIPPPCHSKRAALSLLGTGPGDDCGSRCVRRAPSLGFPLGL